MDHDRSGQMLDGGDGGFRHESVFLSRGCLIVSGWVFMCRLGEHEKS
jgi:hypothetical protein